MNFFVSCDNYCTCMLYVVWYLLFNSRYWQVVMYCVVRDITMGHYKSFWLKSRKRICGKEKSISFWQRTTVVVSATSSEMQLRFFFCMCPLYRVVLDREKRLWQGWYENGTGSRWQGRTTTPRMLLYACNTSFILRSISV